MWRRGRESNRRLEKISVNRDGCRSQGSRAPADDFRGKLLSRYSSPPLATIAIQPIPGVRHALPPNRRRYQRVPPALLPPTKDPPPIVPQLDPSPAQRVPREA